MKNQNIQVELKGLFRRVFFFMVFLTLIVNTKLSAQYGPNSGSSYVGVNFDNSNWSYEHNIYAQDDAYGEITNTSFDNGENSDIVRIKGFGFSIPSGTTISGIKVEMDRSLAAGSCNDNSIRLLNTSGVEIGDNKSNGDAWVAPDLDIYTSFGGDGDMWGTTLTAEDINDPDFGVSFQVTATSNNTKPRVDHIRITVYTGLTTLPVELSEYTASASSSDNQVHLNWVTSSEVNNDFFSVERSNDTDNWEVLTEISGQGNTSETTDYSFTDLAPLPGVSFYRLKQTDFDGTFTYSDIQKVETTSHKSISLLPTVTKTTFNINGFEEGMITIINSNGVVLDQIYHIPGNTRFGESLMKGVYFVNFSSLNGTQSFRVIKL